MGTPMSRCCLAHWAMEMFSERRPVELQHPATGGNVTYAEDHAEHLWARVEYNVDGQSVASAELHSLTDLFTALSQDEDEGYLAVVNGEAVRL